VHYDAPCLFLFARRSRCTAQSCSSSHINSLSCLGGAGKAGAASQPCHFHQKRTRSPAVPRSQGCATMICMVSVVCSFLWRMWHEQGGVGSLVARTNPAYASTACLACFQSLFKSTICTHAWGAEWVECPRYAGTPGMPAPLNGESQHVSMQTNGEGGKILCQVRV
jgi:hypothetical protein